MTVIFFSIWLTIRFHCVAILGLHTYRHKFTKDSNHVTFSMKFSV